MSAIFAGYVLHSIATFVETPPSDEMWRDRIAEARSAGLPFLVAEVDGAVEGFAHVTRFRPHAAYRYTVEDSIYIAPEASGRGVGSRLLAGVLDGMRGTEVRQVVAVIAADRRVAARHPVDRAAPPAGVRRGRPHAVGGLQERPVGRHRAHAGRPAPRRLSETPDARTGRPA